MTPSPSPAAGASRGPSTTLLVAVGVALAVAGAAAWMFLGGDGARAPAVDDGPSAGTSYVPATRMDAAAARLTRTGSGATLELVLAGVAPGDTFYTRLRDSRQNPKRPMIFVDRGPATSDIGVLETTVADGPTPGERRLSIAIPTAVEHVTVVDLRASGRWEGIELDVADAK